MKAIWKVAGMAMGLAVCDGAAAAAAKKAETYPARPIRFVVPFAPGGPSDILSRLMGQKLGESFGGTPVVIDNRGAVGGIVGAELGASAPPDGYTLLMAANSLLTINPHVYRKLGYNPERDLAPITQLTSTGNVVVVHPSVAASSLKEFIALAKAKPGQINYATTGTGNVLGIAAFKSKADIDMVAIPYKGTGQAVIDLVGGQVQMFFMNPLVAVSNVKAGKLRALAITSLDRNPALPEVPTVSETALPGYKNITWHSILVPSRTPKDLVKRLNVELVRIVNMPEVKDRFIAQGMTPVGSTPEQVLALMREESQEHAKLVKQIGLQVQ